jgi:hypothetical protein
MGDSMSSVVISGDTSGAITLAAPAVSGTNTATLPAATGTVMVSGNMPAFSATCNSTTTIGTGAQVKIILPVENFDTASCYNNTGSTVGSIPSYSFLPNVAGYYQVNGSIQISGTTAGQVLLYKNGSIVIGGTYSGVAGTGSSTVMSYLVYLNGTTDYISMYGYVDAGTTAANNPTCTYFQASLVRAG